VQVIEEFHQGHRGAASRPDDLFVRLGVHFFVLAEVVENTLLERVNGRAVEE
jgi:hypothetical protein